VVTLEDDGVVPVIAQLLTPAMNIM
jgi:hypothetical protein